MRTWQLDDKNLGFKPAEQELYLAQSQCATAKIYHGSQIVSFAKCPFAEQGHFARWTFSKVDILHGGLFDRWTFCQVDILRGGPFLFETIYKFKKYFCT